MHSVGAQSSFERDKASVPVIRDLNSLVEVEEFDFVLLSVPNFGKNDIPLEVDLIARGLIVACTKWRLKDWGSHWELERAIQGKPGRYFVHDHYHLTSTFQTAKTRLAEIGTVQNIQYRFAVPPSPSGFSPWVKSYQELVLEDLCYHHFSVLQFLCGLNFGDGWCYSRSSGVEQEIHNMVDLVARSHSGWILNYSAAWGVDVPHWTSWPGNVTVIGEKGWIEVSKEALSVNGKTVPPDEMQPPVDWIQSVLQQIEGTGETARCVLHFSQYSKVAAAIQQALQWNKAF